MDATMCYMDVDASVRTCSSSRNISWNKSIETNCIRSEQIFNFAPCFIFWISNYFVRESQPLPEETLENKLIVIEPKYTRLQVQSDWFRRLQINFGTSMSQEFFPFSSFVHFKVSGLWTTISVHFININNYYYCR